MKISEKIQKLKLPQEVVDDVVALEEKISKLEHEVLWHKNGSKGSMKVMMGSFRVPVKRSLLPWTR